ncbi:alpha/beta hydrolase [Picosynechococcus sp. NKBG042902]|uniref:alpha/beta hydrolase n=1 Tax=Picosynechococcus sp. NKBG042902 TaxID=490193 RepID=UPI0005EDE2BA|nr:alpha/beta hydrolase [Picosynechococcus sp. NKBG042902]
MQKQLRNLKVWGIAGLLCLGWGTSEKAIAAETLRLKLGPLQQTLQLRDLEIFAETGQVPQSLRPYGMFLDGNLQKFLQRRLEIEPEMADQFFDQLWRSPTGKQILAQIQTALPGTSVQDLQATVNLVLGQGVEISALNLLQAYPKQELTIDLTAVASLLLQLNLPNIQNQLLAPRVTDALESTEPQIFQRANLNPTAPGSQTVRRQSLILQDERRDRTIPIDIFDSPQSQSQLVVLSHGFAANRHFLDYLAVHLASHGYTVVTLDHPGSNIQSLFNPGLNLDTLLPATEFVDRPKDIQFVLDQLERLNQDQTLTTRFATDNVTVIGHSFGGYTALAIAGGVVDPIAIRAHCQRATPLTRAPGDWLQCAAAKLPYDQLNLRDERVKQAIALNPLSDQIFGEQGLEKIKIPTLIVASTKDTVTPSLAHQLKPFQQLGGEKYLVVADGATHMSVTDVSNRDSALAQSTLVPEVMGNAAEPVRQMVRGVSLSFLARHQTRGQNYQQFLTGAYVQSLSQGAIKLRLTETISPELERFLSRLPQAPSSTAATTPTQQAAFLNMGRSPNPSPNRTYPQGVLTESLKPLMTNLEAETFLAMKPDNFDVLYQKPGRISEKR